MEGPLPLQEEEHAYMIPWLGFVHIPIHPRCISSCKLGSVEVIQWLINEKRAQRQRGTRRRGDCMRRMWLLLHKADPRTGCRDCWGADGVEQFLCFDCLGWRALEVAQHNARIKVTHSAVSTHPQGNVERERERRLFQKKTYPRPSH